jgi:hypothetical protein
MRKRREDFMRVIVLTFAATVAATPVAADYLVKEVGSFHVGGRTETLSGLPTKDIVFSAGAPPIKVDPNGEFEVEQMYVQYVKLAQPKGRGAAAAVAWRWPLRRLGASPPWRRKSSTSSAMRRHLWTRRSRRGATADSQPARSARRAHFRSGAQRRVTVCCFGHGSRR